MMPSERLIVDLNNFNANFIQVLLTSPALLRIPSFKLMADEYQKARLRIIQEGKYEPHDYFGEQQK